MKPIDLEALKRWKRKNQNERLQFVADYARWLKKAPNKEWSTQQARLSKQVGLQEPDKEGHTGIRY